MDSNCQVVLGKHPSDTTKYKWQWYYIDVQWEL